MTRENYADLSAKAMAAKMVPANNDMTCGHWRELGITRQTAFNWRTKGRGAPLEARLAVAWIMKYGVK